MNRHIKFTIITFCCLLISSILRGSPVRNPHTAYTQPDGSTFQVKVKGDEWLKIKTTSDGCAIVRDDDGWWCYGVYDDEGILRNTGIRVGTPASSAILAESRNIPYCRLRAAAVEKKKKVRDADLVALRSARAANSATTKSATDLKSKRGIAILAQFQDVRFTYTKEDFHNLLNKKNYNNTGSAKDYYEQQFGQGWEFTFDVSDIVTLPHNLKYYGENYPPDDDNGNDIRPALMAWEACKAAEDLVDFSLYDEDGDGEVENVYIFYAGRDESENTDQTDLLWAHQYYIISSNEVPGVTQLDGVWIDRYACSSELSGIQDLTGIGTFCHEYMHTFGVPDFYDTDYDYDGAWAAGLWKKTSLMDGGNYNNNSATPPNLNCIERYLLGLSEPLEIKAGNTYTLEPVHKNGQFYKMDGLTGGEYYLFECRSNEGWDKYIGGKGMLVYHIDENEKEYVSGEGYVRKWDYNTVNTDPTHQCADLIEADNRSDEVDDYTSYSNLKGIFFPHGNTSLTPDSHPSYRFWKTGDPGISIIGITSSGDNVTFSAVIKNEIPEIPEVSGFEFTAFPDAVFISFKASIPDAKATAAIEWKKNSETEIHTAHIMSSSQGRYSYLITGLESGKVLYDISVRFVSEGISGKTYSTGVMTGRTPSVTWPYLLLGGVPVSRTDGFIDYVINTPNAVKREWHLDGEPLKADPDLRIRPGKDGTLECTITWKDGSTDTIIKEITVSE